MESVVVVVVVVATAAAAVAVSVAVAAAIDSGLGHDTVEDLINTRKELYFSFPTGSLLNTFMSCAQKKVQNIT